MSNLGTSRSEFSAGISEGFGFTPLQPGVGEHFPDQRELSISPDRAKEAEAAFASWSRNLVRIAAQADHLTQRFPESAALWGRSAAAYMSAGDTAKAREHARRAIVLALPTGREGNPDVPAFCMGMLVLRRQGQTDEVIELLQGARNPAFRLLHASALSDRARWTEALDLLADDEDTYAKSLRGYISLKLGRPAEAIRDLRGTLRDSPTDVGSLLNLASAFRQLGAHRKALRAVEQAQRLAPGRMDGARLHIEILADLGRWQEVRSMSNRLRHGGNEQDAFLTMLEAQASFQLNRGEAGFKLLSHSASAAESQGLEILAAELRANVRVAEYHLRRRSQRQVRYDILRELEKQPDSGPLLQMFAEFSELHADARDVRRFFDAKAADRSDERWFSVAARLAYLEYRFEDSLQTCREWVQRFPQSRDPYVALMLLVGHVNGNWAESAQLARRAMGKFEISDYLANQAAYSMALAGDPGGALRVLDKAPGWNYRLEATKGLVLISGKQVAQGLRHYRRAAELLREEESETQSENLSLMVTHQAMALRKLGIVELDVDDPQLKASSLPPVDLPSNWRQIPAFVLLQRRAEREGWPWPTLIS